MVTVPSTRDEIFHEVTRILNQPDFKKWGMEVKVLVIDCRALKVRDDETQALAADKISLVVGLKKQIEARRKEVTKRYKGIVDAVNNGVAREWTIPLEDAERYLKEEVKQHQAEVDMQRLKEQEMAKRKSDRMRQKIEKEAAKLGVEAPKIPDAVIPKQTGPIRGMAGGKISTRKVWKTRLVDMRELAKAVGAGKAMQELLIFNESFGNTLARRGVREIPGVEIYQETGVSGYAK